jgi:RNA polymerase sigma-32 factor
MDRRLRGDVSLNVPIHDEDESGQTLDWLVDPAPTSEISLAEEQETEHRRRALADALATLNPRERNIITARWLTEGSATLEELAAEHGVSRERVRQIEQRAFQKVKAAMLANRREADGPLSSRAKEMKQREARPSRVRKTSPDGSPCLRHRSFFS